MTRPYPQVHPHVLVRGDAAAGGGGSSSGVGLPFSGAEITLASGSAQSIETGVAEEIIWLTDSYDEGGWIDNTTNKRLQVPVGVTKAQFGCSISISGMTAANLSIRLFEETIGLVEISDFNSANVPGTENFTTTFPTMAVVAGQVYYIMVYQANGVTETLPVAGNTDPARFTATAIETVAPSVTPRGALATMSADITGQDVTTITAVPFDSELRDTDSIHDNVTNPSRMTVPIGATHVRLSGQIGVGAITSSLFVQAQVYKNGAIFDPAIVSKAEVSDVSQYVQVHVPILAVSPGDYFELMVRVETDTSVTLLDVGSYFEMEIVAPVLVAKASHRGAVVTMAASRTGQNYSAGANVTWDSEVYDTDNIHDLVTNTSRLTVPPGVSKVRLDGGIGFSLVFAGGVGVLKFKHNGAFLSPGPEMRIEMNNTDPSFCISSFVIEVSPGDYMELNLLQTDNNMTLRANECYFAMEIIE